MGELRFEWDELKNIENARKHGVRFEEAGTAFFDVHALLTPDDEHTKGEERFVLVGASAIHRTLVVCHRYRSDSAVIRIISARRATRSEKADYERRWSI